MEENRQGNNPWARVLDNVDVTASGTTTAGGKDRSRMKAAMLARKADLTKSGGPSQQML